MRFELIRIFLHGIHYLTIEPTLGLTSLALDSTQGSQAFTRNPGQNHQSPLFQLYFWRRLFHSAEEEAALRKVSHLLKMSFSEMFDLTLFLLQNKPCYTSQMEVAGCMK